VYTEVNARVQHWTQALAQGQDVQGLDAEEARLADEINKTAGMRAWDLWRTQIRAQVNW
jgi:HCOMODA/2-hydroxy-3-carboxy-muconic semialdehyde decarboxylase